MNTTPNKISRFFTPLAPLAMVAFLAVGCGTPRPELSSPQDAILDSTVGADPNTLVILGLNDFHGALAPQKLKTNEVGDIPSQEFQAGGASILGTHVKLLKREFGEKLLIVNAGDEWQGSLDSNLEEGASVVRFFNALGVHAAAVGNHEFDFGEIGDFDPKKEGDVLGAFRAQLKEAHYPYLAVNLLEKSTGKPPKIDNLYPSILKDVNGIKVGIIGMATPQTPATTRIEYVRSLQFGNLSQLKESVVKESKELRKKGAQVILLTGHVPLTCQGPGSTFPEGKEKYWFPNTPQAPCAKKDQKNDEMAILLSDLPKGTVDAAIAGHSHTIVHHYIKGIPVIQGGAYNTYYNLIFLKIDPKSKTVSQKDTVIQGPIPICEKVFENQLNCNGKQPAPPQGRGKLVSPYFRGKEIVSDPDIEDLLRETFKRTAEIKKQVIGSAERTAEHVRTRESALGNLFADAIRQRAGTDFSLVNPGGIRVPQLDSGPITFEKLYNAHPFDNTLSVLKVKGSELKTIFKIANNGSRGVFSHSGLKVTLLRLDGQAQSQDFNKNGRIEAWEINRLVKIQAQPTLTGPAVDIDDSKYYTLATNDFLMKGGDDLEWIMNQISEDRKVLDAGGFVRDVVQKYIETHSPINTDQNPLVHPSNPRIVFVDKMPSASSQKKQHRRTQKRKSSKG